MQKRHSDPALYFQEQAYTTTQHVIPFIRKRFSVTAKTVVAEIGCSLGGNMLPFLEMGCRVYGIDINRGAIENARKLYAQLACGEELHLINSDIYDIEPSSLPQFDLIVIRDVIEHIHGHERFIRHLEKFLNPNGVIFIAFPPFMMPFGGHQQMCAGKLTSRIPYFHLLPRAMYAGMLRMLGETPGKIDGLLEIKDTRLHLWKFHRIIRGSRLRIVEEKRFLINPNYEIKFGLKPCKLPFWLNIPVVRELFITSCYALLSPKPKP